MQESNPEIIATLSLHKDEKYCCDGSSPDDIFITGLSGRYPFTDTVDELKEKLFRKEKFLQHTEKRWKDGTKELPPAEYGIINGFDKLDIDFFNIPYINCDHLEPTHRLILTVAYEAVMDSGYNPFEKRGRPIGVYCGLNQPNHKDLFVNTAYMCDWDTTAFLHALSANRVSYVMDFTGASCVVDSVTTSSACALHLAIKDMISGRVEAAIVVSGQSCANPEYTKNAIVHGICSIGKPACPFDSKACGLMRTEAITAVFLQLASESRRCYAKIMNMTCDASGYVPEGIFKANKDQLKQICVNTLNGCGLNVQDIGYMEAHGSAKIFEDAVELNAISEVYCNERTEPLLIGTIKSNIGNSEGAATLCSLAKSIIALDSGMIPPNLNYDDPNPQIPALTDGRLKVVTESTELPSPYIAINSMGLAGLHSQLILKQNPIKPIEKKRNAIPNLLLYSATTDEAVKYAFDAVIKNPYPSEFFSLLNNIAFTPIKSKPYRGFALLTEDPVSEIGLCLEDKREIWYVVTGMGCQWPGMGSSLMEVDVFANSIRRSAKVLERFGVDLLELMKPHTKHLLQNRRITPAFVSICAIQMALVDTLRELGIEPDGIVGHSTGELVCAYADGCCTLEQTITSAYLRGKTVEASNLPDGAMAAVGISWEEAKAICPHNVYPVCHNAEDSITISGPTEPLKEFVSKLKEEGKFARVVDAYGYAFHCKEISPAAPLLKAELESVITEPKLRSKRWRSTSYPPDQWDKPEAGLADATYFVHNLMSTVHFAEALAYIPKNAITIEIAPHFLLQSVLKRVIGNNASYLGLMKRQENTVNFMLTTIGKMYKLGLNPKINCLTPPPRYPVPRGTPSISSLYKWDTSFSFDVSTYVKIDFVRIIDLKLYSSDKFLLDYNVGGRTLYPAMGYIELAWFTLSRKIDKKMKDLPIIVEDFRVHQAVTISASEKKKTFKVRISNCSGKFEILDGDYLAASGRIEPLLELTGDPCTATYRKIPAADIIPAEDFYQDLKVCGYEYGPQFKELVEINIEGSQGLVRWSNNWITFLQAHLLFFEFPHEQPLSLPAGALSIKIDPRKVYSSFQECNENWKGQPVTYNKYTQYCCSPGIEIRRVTFEPLPFSPVYHTSPILEEYKFVPYIQEGVLPANELMKYKEYINVCSKVARKVASSVDQDLAKKLEICLTVDVKADVIERYLTEQNNEHVILQTLNKFSNSLPNLKGVNGEFEKNLKRTVCSDMLYRTLFNVRYLRSLLDIIADNTFNNLNAVEVFNGSYFSLDLVTKIMKRFHNRKLNSTLLCDESYYMNTEALKETGIKVQSFQTNKAHGIQRQDIIIIPFLFGDAKIFQKDLNFYCSLAHGGSYILLYHRTSISPSEVVLSYLHGEALQTTSESDIQTIFEEQHLNIISKKSDSLGSTLYLLRYHDINLSPVSDIIVNIKEGNNEWVNQLKLSMASASGRIWLVADDSPTNGIIGLAKCLKQEPGGEKIRCVHVIKDGKLGRTPAFDLKNSFYAEIAERDILMNVYGDGTWGAFSHFEISAEHQGRHSEHSFLTYSKGGDLTSLQWVESSISYDLETCQKDVVYVHFAAVNSRDAMLATTKILPNIQEEASGSSALGLEFSGVTADGRRVMGLTAGEAISTTIRSNDSLLFDIPESWTLEEAATVPLVYCACYHALCVYGELQPMEIVLISAHSEDTKTAAIRIALSLKCKVFITVYPNERKGYLKKKFPEITEIEVDVMKSLSIYDFIMRHTKEGVDVVLNANNDQQNIIACIRCVKKYGRFLNISKYDLDLNKPLGLKIFLKNILLASVFLEKLLKPGKLNTEVLKNVVELFNEGVSTGVVKPLERTVFQSNDAVNAFRYVINQKGIGKTVLKIREEIKAGLTSEPLKIKARSSAYFYKHKTYIIVGGLGDFGIELTKWMLKNGARNIVLTSRHEAWTPHQNKCLTRWKSQGVNVQVHTLDASYKEKANQLIKVASSIGPIGGIFNCAVVIRDGFIENQTVEYFDDVTAAKNMTAKNLDELSRIMCPQLDYFVCFSSVSSSKGIATMSNDGYANSSMERICENRRRDGKHGLAMQLGIIGDVGFVHRLIGEGSLVADTEPQKVYSILDTLGYFLQLNQPVLSSYVMAGETKVEMGKSDFLLQLTKFLGISNIADIDKTLNLKDLGVDSLVGSALKNWLECFCNLIIPIKSLLQMTINDLISSVERKTLKREPLPEEGIKKDEFVPAYLSVPKILLPDCPILSLNTQKTGVPAFIIHPLHTELLKFEPVAQNLFVPVYGLFLTKGMLCENITLTAITCLKEIKKYCSEFHLIGLSTGSALAFEIAVQSQNNHDDFPAVASTLFLDGVSYLTEAFRSNQYAYNPSIKEAEDIYDFLMQFSTDKTPTILKDLYTKNDSESRLFYAVKQILASSLGNLTNAEVYEAIRLYLKALELLREHHPQTKLISNLVFIESPGKLLPYNISLVKTIISEFCSGQIYIHRILNCRNVGKETSISTAKAQLISQLL